MEYCHFGNLRNYILKHKDEYQDTMNDDYLDPVTKKMREAGDMEESSKTEVTKGKPHYVNKAAPDNTANLVGPPLTKKNMISWAFQVARGMEYLASKKVCAFDCNISHLSPELVFETAGDIILFVLLRVSIIYR